MSMRVSMYCGKDFEDENSTAEDYTALYCSRRCEKKNSQVTLKFSKPEQTREPTNEEDN